MLLEHWDEKLDGKLEEDKVVEQVIKGQKALGRVFWELCLFCLIISWTLQICFLLIFL